MRGLCGCRQTSLTCCFAERVVPSRRLLPGLEWGPTGPGRRLTAHVNEGPLTYSYQHLRGSYAGDFRLLAEPNRGALLL